jgi:hypothetical protein
MVHMFMILRCLFICAEVQLFLGRRTGIQNAGDNCPLTVLKILFGPDGTHHAFVDG